MGLSVRSSRCAAISMIIFGLLIFVPAGFFITFSIIYGHPVLNWVWRSRIEKLSYTNIILNYSWYLGYTSLLALITSITGCIGTCASAHRIHRDTCLTVTLFIFSLMVAGLSAYAIYDLSIIISITRIFLVMKCSASLCSLIFLSIEGSLLGLAILVFLLSSWAIICCLASFCCHTEVEPEPVLPARQTVGGQQGVMMQGAVMVPMMRTDTIPVVTPPHYAMMQPAQGMPVAPFNPAPQQQSQAMPVQVVGHPVVMKTDQERNDETVA